LKLILGGETGVGVGGFVLATAAAEATPLARATMLLADPPNPIAGS
jgi:hypothetical protein